jgi:hypothetical protein
MARSAALDEFLSSSVQAGGQMMLLITNMGQAIRTAYDIDAEPETVEEEIVEIVGRHLCELDDGPSEEELRVAERVVRWATEAIGNELFGPPEHPEERNWVPEMRLRLRHLDGGPLPLDDEFPPTAGELLN